MTLSSSRNMPRPTLYLEAEERQRNFQLQNIFIGQSKLPDRHQLHHNSHCGSYLLIYREREGEIEKEREGGKEDLLFTSLSFFVSIVTFIFIFSRGKQCKTLSSHLPTLLVHHRRREPDNAIGGDAKSSTVTIFLWLS